MRNEKSEGGNMENKLEYEGGINRRVNPVLIGMRLNGDLSKLVQKWFTPT